MWFHFVSNVLSSLISCLSVLKLFELVNRWRRSVLPSSSQLGGLVKSFHLSPAQWLSYLQPLGEPQISRRRQNSSLSSLNPAPILTRAPQVDKQQLDPDFQSLVENAPDIIVRLDRDFRYLYVNARLEHDLGCDRTQILGKTSQELGFSEALIQVWHHAAEQVFVTAQEQEIEFEAASVQGLAHYSSRIVPEFSPQGTVRSVIAITRNITPQKQAERVVQQQFQQGQILWDIAQTIRRSLHLDDTLQTAVNEICTFLNSDRVIIYRFDSNCSGTVVVESVKPGYKTMLHEAVLDPCLDILGVIKRYSQGYAYVLNDAYAANLTPCHQQMLAQFGTRANLVVPVLLQNDQLWGLLAAQQCEEARNWQPWEVELLKQLATQVGIAIQQAELYEQLELLNTELEQQVDQRTQELQQALEFESSLKRITDKVRDSLDEHEILQVAVNELAIGLGVKCCDAAIYNAEQTISTIIHESNHSLSSIVGQQMSIDSFCEPEIYKLLLQGNYCQFCFTSAVGLRPTNDRYAFLACPIIDDKRVLGDLWLMKSCEEHFNDQEIRLVQQVVNQCAIALRQARLYQEAQQQVQELERLNQLKDDFLSTVSHELRSPMSNIYMASQMLELFLNQYGAFEDSSNSAGRYFNILQTECRREISLVNNLLDLSRLDASADPLVLTQIDLAPWIVHLVEPFESRIAKQQQNLILDIPSTLPALTTDLACLEKALTELIHNACKYTPTGRSIAIVAEATPLDLVLKVQNSGIEIPAEELPRIFDKFHRVPSNDPWKHEGTGLGLALVKKRIEQIQGSITVQSGTDWTSFVIHLPWALNPQTPHHTTMHPCYLPTAV